MTPEEGPNPGRIVYVVGHNEWFLFHLKFDQSDNKTLGSERNEMTYIFRASMRYFEGVKDKREQELREAFSFWMEGLQHECVLRGRSQQKQDVKREVWHW